MIRRPPRSTQSRSSAASDVYKRQDMDHPLDRDNWPIVAASPLPYHPDSQQPREMTRADMERVREQFTAAATMGSACGFDMLELHRAQGYLLAVFFSPATTRRPAV